MPEKSINHVLAENLSRLMAQQVLTQAQLALRAGISQKTVSNYLNPDQRTESTSGKQPSAKLAELERIAQALEVPVWQLMREMSPREQRLYDRIEKAYEELRAADEVEAKEPTEEDRRLFEQSKVVSTPKPVPRKRAA